jgi:hypothetical protein
MSEFFPKDEQIVNLADYMAGIMTREELEEYVWNDLYVDMKNHGPDTFLSNCRDLDKEPEFFLHENYEVDRGGLSI